MAEWLKAHAWRACERVTVPWVRIPLCPLPPQPEVLGDGLSPGIGKRSLPTDEAADALAPKLLHDILLRGFGLSGKFGTNRANWECEPWKNAKSCCARSHRRNRSGKLGARGSPTTRLAGSVAY